MGIPSNPYNEGGVHTPNPGKAEDKQGAEACNVKAGSATTAANNPNATAPTLGSH